MFPIENFKTLYVDSDKELLVFVDCTIIQRCLDDSFVIFFFFSKISICFSDFCIFSGSKEVQVDFLPENGCARKDACKDNGDVKKLIFNDIHMLYIQIIIYVCFCFFQILKKFAKCSAKGNSLWEVSDKQ